MTVKLVADAIVWSPTDQIHDAGSEGVVTETLLAPTTVD